jgi:hypothetical protein
MANGQSELDREGCEFGRNLKKDIENLKTNTGREVKAVKKDIAGIVDNLQNRPTWSTTVIITFLTSLSVGLVVALLG